MARGWESKSVEGQVEEFKAKADGKQKIKLTREEAETARQREVLGLARARIQSELQTTSNPRRREQLNRALEHIESQLAANSAPLNDAG
jgi:polyribonucleotide nucleotidyltransferase